MTEKKRFTDMATSIPLDVLDHLGKFFNDVNESLAAGLAGQGDAA